MHRLRTIVYIDGFNLYHRCTKKARRYKWLDLRKLAEVVLEDKFKILKVKFYTAELKKKEDNSNRMQRKRQLNYLSALRTIKGLEIIEGKFLWDSRYKRYVEKRSDVNLACDLVYDSLTEQIEYVVLISNDSDITRALEVARKKAGKMVIVISPTSENISFDLRKVAHRHLVIKRLDLQESQLPNKVNGEGGTTIEKPFDW